MGCFQTPHAPPQVYTVNEHTLEMAELIARYYEPGQDAALGLSEDAAASLLRVHGPNVLTAPPPRSALSRWLKQAADPLLLLLLFASILAFISFGLTLRCALFFCGAAFLPAQAAAGPPSLPAHPPRQLSRIGNAAGVFGQ